MNALQTFNVSTGSAYNTAVGTLAGGALTTGDLNTLIGGLSGDALTTGGRNVALGYNALSADTTGGRAVAIGVGALENQNFTDSTINYNVAVGYDAGLNVTTGQQNVYWWTSRRFSYCW